MNLDKKIKMSFTWNAIESVAFQSLLGAHQFMLYKCSSSAHYGLIGTVFAVIYLLATGIVGGFDQALTPFFNEICRDKAMFKRIVFVSLLKQLIIMGALLIGALVLVGPLGIVHFPLISYPIIILAFLIALCEGMRRIAKTILQFFFKIRTVAFFELLFLVIYLVIVWTGYFCTGQLSLWLLVLPLLATSVCANCVYWTIAIRQYHALPAAAGTHLEILNQRIIRNRAVNFLNTVGHMFYSSNFLVPLFAVLSGLEIAGLFKLISYWCYTVTPIIQRVFGISSQTLFAGTKQSPTSEKIMLFFRLNAYLIKSLSVVFFCLFAVLPLAHRLGIIALPAVPWTLIGLFITLLLSENIIIVYENFCIAEEKLSVLLAYQAISFLLYFGMYANVLSKPMEILIGLLIARFVSYTLLILLTKRTFPIQLKTKHASS